MPRRRQPRQGSLQYWPRKRARRIYTRARHWPESKETKPLGFAGWKAGMTHIQTVDSNAKSPTFNRVVVKPVTIIDSPSLFVCGLRLYSSSASSSSSPSFHVIAEKWVTKLPRDLHLIRKTTPARKHFDDKQTGDDVRLIVCTQPAKSGMRKMKPDVFEMAIGGGTKQKLEYAESVLGKEISAKDVFKPGEFVDVSAVTKGRGYQGPVKRYHIRIQTRKDKQMHRHVGSIGSTVPRKVDWRVPQAGQYGFFARTEFSKRVIMIEDDAKKVTPRGGFVGYGLVPHSFVMIEGSVPGPEKRLVRLRKATRVTKVIPADVKYISVESKQGA